MTVAAFESERAVRYAGHAAPDDPHLPLDQSPSNWASARNARARTVEKFPRNPAKYVMVPGNARARHPVIEQRIREIGSVCRETTRSTGSSRATAASGIITAGVAYQYAKEIFPTASVLKLGMTWPLPEQMIRDFAASVSTG